MDAQLTTLKRKYLTSEDPEDKIRWFSALIRAGRIQDLEKLTTLWDSEALKAVYGLDYDELYKTSDHIEGICSCINCITTDKLHLRFMGVARNQGELHQDSLWKKFLDLHSKCFIQTPRYTTLQDFMDFDLTFRKAVINILVKEAIKEL